MEFVYKPQSWPVQNENTNIQYNVWFINTEISVFIVKSTVPVPVILQTYEGVKASGARRDLVNLLKVSQISQKTNDFFSRISALKKRSD